MKMPQKPRPPSHLSAQAKRWWQQVMSEFEIEQHDLPKLEMAAAAIDTHRSAMSVLRRQGLTFLDAGKPKMRPECLVARDAAVLHARLTRELNLDLETPEIRIPRNVRRGA